MPHFFDHYVKGKPRYVDLDDRKSKDLPINYINQLQNKVKKVFGTKVGGAMEQQIQENKSSIVNYFKDREWTLQDFENNTWTKHTKHKHHYFGKIENKFNKDNILYNCNGAYINADGFSDLTICTFADKNSRYGFVKSYIIITKDSFTIYAGSSSF